MGGEENNNMTKISEAKYDVIIYGASHNYRFKMITTSDIGFGGKVYGGIYHYQILSQQYQSVEIARQKFFEFVEANNIACYRFPNEIYRGNTDLVEQNIKAKEIV